MPQTTLDDECFFIAPIGEDGSQERQRSDGVFQFIVEKAAEELGLHAVRADKIDSPGQISLQVINHVLGAKAVVADLTGLNANVFYELAVRHTARLPVALICEAGTRLPFDVGQMRTIFLDHTNLGSADSCRRQIVEHLRSAMEGAVDSPIATAIDVSQLQSGNPAERSLAEVLNMLEELSARQRETLLLLSRGRAQSDATLLSIAEIARIAVDLKRMLDNPESAKDRHSLMTQVDQLMSIVERVNFIRHHGIDPISELFIGHDLNHTKDWINANSEKLSRATYIAFRENLEE